MLIGFESLGGLAQLGERYNGIVEVIGSSPLSSTFVAIYLKPSATFAGGFFLRIESNHQASWVVAQELQVLRIPLMVCNLNEE